MVRYTVRLRTSLDRTGTEQEQNRNRTGTEKEQSRNRAGTEQEQNRNRTGTEREQEKEQEEEKIDRVNFFFNSNYKRLPVALLEKNLNKFKAISIFIILKFNLNI